MATVTQFWTDPKPSLWQKFGTTANWTWAHGDDQFCWAFVVRPLQANAAVSVQAPLVAQSDNDMAQSTMITVTVGPSPSCQPVRRDAASLYRNQGSDAMRLQVLHDAKGSILAAVDLDSRHDGPMPRLSARRGQNLATVCTTLRVDAKRRTLVAVPKRETRVSSKRG